MGEGITHIDMLKPRVRTLNGRQLAWSPSTSKRGVTAEVTKVPKSIIKKILIVG